jgi:hypothetical protein
VFGKDLEGALYMAKSARLPVSLSFVYLPMIFSIRILYLMKTQSKSLKIREITLREWEFKLVETEQRKEDSQSLKIRELEKEVQRLRASIRTCLNSRSEALAQVTATYGGS